MDRLTMTGEANPQPLLNRLQETTDPFAVFDRGSGGLCTGGSQPHVSPLPDALARIFAAGTVINRLISGQDNASAAISFGCRGVA